MRLFARRRTHVSEKTDSPEQKAKDHDASGPYDLAIFIAKSFGKSLPVVIIIGLIAYGAWYGIREASVLQTRVLEAERQRNSALIEKEKAEGEAKSAADRAKSEALR